MDLTTRCPKCETVFQASLADLQLRKGYIRCVHCAYIFDGYAMVVSETDNEPFVEQDAIQAADNDYMGDADTDAAYINESYVGADNTKPDYADQEFKITDQSSDLSDHEQFTVSLGASNKPAQSESFIVEADPKRRRGSAYNPSDIYSFKHTLAKFCAYVLLILLLILLLLQGAYIYRAQIAQNLNFTRPILEKYCSYLNCTVPYLRDIDSLVITKSAFKLIKTDTPKAADTGSTDNQANNHTVDSKPSADTVDGAEINKVRNYELQFNLRNLATQAQEWPTVVLNLKDSSGQIQIRRNIPPSVYLDEQTAAIPAQSEIFVRLPVQLLGDTQVNGFHLDLFFP